jgi:CheY-like chemotaxis protein
MLDGHRESQITGEEEDRILVVDDDARSLKNVASFLRLEGYGVDEACDGNEAVNRLDNGEFDLILSDVFMPRLNGIQLLEYVRSVRPQVPFYLCRDFATLRLMKPSNEGPRTLL